MSEQYRDYFIKRRISLIRRILQIFTLVIGTMAIIRYAEKDYTQFFADILLLIFLVFGYLKLKNDHNQYLSVAREIFMLTIFVSIFVMIHQSDNPVRFIWFSTIIYMVFYLFEKDEALYWVTFVMLVLALFYIYNPDIFAINTVQFSTWVLNMFIILMIAHWYASSEEESTKKLFAHRENLAAEIEEKTKALEQKTHELQLLNQNLESKIQAKIEENSSKEKMLFRQARYAQMGEMISMIAHQWRQPLNTISVTTATLQVLMETKQFDERIFQDKIKTIATSVEHLSGTIDDFRNFFKQDKRKQEIRFSQIVQDALELVQPGMGKKGIQIDIECLCECTIFSYPNEIIHVVLNLLKNAEDAFSIQQVDSPRIGVRIFNLDGKPCLEIEDNAGGISSGVMDKIFDPYFTTKEKSDGTGLGLYMSKIIIEEHCHGTIEVENGKEGAVFRLILPAHQQRMELA